MIYMFTSQDLKQGENDFKQPQSKATERDFHCNLLYKNKIRMTSTRLISILSKYRNDLVFRHKLRGLLHKLFVEKQSTNRRKGADHGVCSFAELGLSL